jgi:exonuclease SbcC
LIDVATEILGQMTRGRYALDADFAVVDRTLGGRRGVRTLSGGETFLASLALSLALVEMTDRSGGRVEALFLDEGFGQLDADALDAALAELDRRARGGRLVAVVSHVHAVAERVEDVLHVTADDAGQSSARWLAPDERQALLDRDAAGLVAL